MIKEIFQEFDITPLDDASEHDWTVVVNAVVEFNFLSGAENVQILNIYHLDHPLNISLIDKGELNNIKLFLMDYVNDNLAEYWYDEQQQDIDLD